MLQIFKRKKNPTTKASNGVTCCDMSSKSLIVCKAITRQNFLRVPHLATKAQLFAIIDLKYKRAVSNNKKQNLTCASHPSQKETAASPLQTTWSDFLWSNTQDVPESALCLSQFGHIAGITMNTAI